MKTCIKKIIGVISVVVLALIMESCKPEVKAHVHTEDAGTLTTEATCTEKGEITYKCTGCGEILRTEEIAPKGHTKGSSKIITEPACFTKGKQSYSCTVCEDLMEIKEIPALGWCEKPVDAETFETAASDSTYIYFGVFPKDVVYQDNSGKLYAADKTTEITIDETEIVTMGGNTYYKGSDGEYYAKVTENAYESGYTYTDTTTVQQSREESIRYFKVEPIKWKVLTTEYDIDGTSGSKTGALLLAKDILTASIPYYESISVRDIDDSAVYPNNYMHSQIRAYLNGISYEASSSDNNDVWKNIGFLQTAFTDDAQKLINTTTVVNNGLSTTDSDKKLKWANGYYQDGTTPSGFTDYTCADTEDKIFLLSEQEVTTAGYGFAAYNSSETGNTRSRFPTDYAKANYAYQWSDYGWWWIRSPYYCEKNTARVIGEDGTASEALNVQETSGGIVPALSISF